MSTFSGAQSVNRLTLAFGLMMLLFMSMTGIGLWTLTDITKLVGNVVHGGARQERLLREWLGETKSNAVRAVVLARTKDAELAALLTPALQDTSQKISELQLRVADLMITAESKALFAVVGESRQQYLAARTAVLESRKAGNFDEAARVVDTRMLPAVNEYVAAIQRLVDHEASYVDRNGQDAIARATAGRITFGGAAFTILCLSICILFWIVIAITKPLLKSLKIVEAISGGDLSRPIRVSSTGEARRLMMALETMRKTLSHQVGAIRAAAGSVSLASREITRGNEDLSRRTEAQAGALEETASSLEELTVAVKNNADSAREADQLASDASGIAVRGGQAMRGVVRTITEISASSKKIADIIGVIDQIAFRTNILSLNAAVEAARAGEQGQGFAVVAAEVRELAQRSARAAREIKALINDSTGQVAAGVSEVEDAGKTMADIVVAVKHLSEINATIANASREQLMGLEHIGTAVTRLDSTTQQNAALVQQTAAAAANMTRQVEEMTNLVMHFVVEQQAEESSFGVLPPSHPNGRAVAPLRVARLRGAHIA